MKLTLDLLDGKTGRHWMSHVVGAYSARILGAAMNLLYYVVLTRLMGAEQTGLFFIGFVVMTLVSTVGRLGLDFTVVRFIAPMAASGDWAGVRGVWRTTLRLTLGCSGLLCATTFAAAEPIASIVFGKKDLVPVLQCFGLTILPVALSAQYAQVLSALKRTEPAMAVLNLWVPVFFTVMLLAWRGQVDATVAAALYFVAAVLTLGVGALQCRDSLSRRRAPSSQSVLMRELLQSGIPLLMLNILVTLQIWAAPIALGIWASAAENGEYSVAHRIGLMIGSFFLGPMEIMLRPRFAEQMASGNTQAAGRLARRSAALMAIVLLPIVSLLCLFPGQLLGVFGEGFTSGAAALAVLALGQFVNVAGGASRSLLTMSGFEVAARDCALFGAVTVVILCVVLVPTYGGMGGAIATSVAIAMQKWLEVLVVWRRLGMLAVPLPKRLFVK